MRALEIAVGIWLGGVFLIGTFIAYVEIEERIKKARRFGAPWWRAFIPAR